MLQTADDARRHVPRRARAPAPLDCKSRSRIAERVRFRFEIERVVLRLGGIVNVVGSKLCIDMPQHGRFGMADLIRTGQDEMEDRWAACMRDEKMEKKMEPKPAMLSWVQNK